MNRLGEDQLIAVASVRDDHVSRQSHDLDAGVTDAASTGMHELEAERHLVAGRPRRAATDARGRPDRRDPELIGAERRQDALETIGVRVDQHGAGCAHADVVPIGQTLGRRRRIRGQSMDGRQRSLRPRKRPAILIAIRAERQSTTRCLDGSRGAQLWPATTGSAPKAVGHHPAQAAVTQWRNVRVTDPATSSDPLGSLIVLVMFLRDARFEA